MYNIDYRRCTPLVAWPGFTAPAAVGPDFNGELLDLRVVRENHGCRFVALRVFRLVNTVVDPNDLSVHRLW